MSRNSAKRVSIAILALLTVGAVFSFQAARAEEASEDQILRALTPAKREPLTRSLSMGRRRRAIRPRPRPKAS